MSLESEIQRSFLFNILSSNDEKELDSFIDWDNKNTRMMIKKLGALISCKQNGLLSNTDVKIATDRKLTKSYLSGNVDLDRLKTLLRLELGSDGKSLRDVNELIKLDYATHEELMRYLDSNVKEASPVVADALPIAVEASPFVELSINQTEKDINYLQRLFSLRGLPSDIKANIKTMLDFYDHNPIDVSPGVNERVHDLVENLKETYKNHVPFSDFDGSIMRERIMSNYMMGLNGYLISRIRDNIAIPKELHKDIDEAIEKYRKVKNYSQVDVEDMEKIIERVDDDGYSIY